MKDGTVIGYTIEIDGREMGHADDLPAAKQRAMELAGGKASIKLASIHAPAAVLTPSHAHYFSYERNEWIHSPNAAAVQPLPKQP